jgi:hypothetical protein
MSGTFGIDADRTTINGTGTFIAARPGDYEVVFGDPETSTARWPFTIP